VPGEGPRLQGLAHANRRLVAWLQERAPQAVATIDVDATILGRDDPGEPEAQRACDL
jgi:hypothetical protein